MNKRLGLGEVLKLFAVVGFDPKDVHKRLNEAKSFQGFQTVVDTLQVEAKKMWRAKAMELHPDRGGNEEKFKQLQAAYEVITKLKPENMVRPIHPGVPTDQVTVHPDPFEPGCIIVHINLGLTDWDTTSTTTGATGEWWPIT